MKSEIVAATWLGGFMVTSCWLLAIKIHMGFFLGNTFFSITGDSSIYITGILN